MSMPFAIPIIKRSKFPLGSVYITANASDQLAPATVREGLRRHASGDWGEVGRDDAAENQLALTEGFRLLSVYRDGGKKFWIITEADRSVTTVLMPEDY